MTECLMGQKFILSKFWVSKLSGVLTLEIRGKAKLFNILLSRSVLLKKQRFTHPIVFLVYQSWCFKATFF